MVDYKAEYEKVAARQRKLLRKEKTRKGLTKAEKRELRQTIAEKSSLQEHQWD